MYQRAMELAENGKGRRLLNILNRKDLAFTPSMVDTLLAKYGNTGLPRQVELLKKQRGIISNDQYDTMARAVEQNCSHEYLDQFKISLRRLLTCGIPMNPAKMEENE